MSELAQSAYSLSYIMSLLGSAEGTYYQDNLGEFFDNRTEGTVSLAPSGLSFGMMQNDVANNAAAANLFEDLLADAVFNSRITSGQASDFLSRASEVGLKDSPDNFSPTEIALINSAVLAPGIDSIERLDLAQGAIVLNQVDAAIDAVKTQWNSAGVLDPHDPDYTTAIGFLASWANRTGDLNTMQEWLTGTDVAGGVHGSPLTDAPTLADIKFYIRHQPTYTTLADPDTAFAKYTGNIELGANLLPNLVGFPGQKNLFPDLDPAHSLPETVGDALQSGFANAVSASSPLVMDLSSGHTGVSLTTWNASTTSTFFDLNDNGFAVQTAWVSGDTGLLARDINENGKIDSSAELFGSPTVDGFAKLAALDSNHDLRIDNNDADWSTLVVWDDENGDAVTQDGELHSLASLNIASIDLAGVASSTSTISGNPISHVSKVTFTSGATAAIDDAWFVHDNTNSYYSSDYTLDAEALFLPALRGYGSLPELAIAMSQNADLKDLVADFASNFTLDSFADATTLNADVSAILYAWAGVTEVDPEGRGAYIDGQHLAFLETIIGTDFVQLSTHSADPLPQAALQLELAFQSAFDMLAANLLVQVGAGSLFADTVSYNAASGLPTGDTALSETAIADLVDIAPAPGAANVAFWEAVGRFIDNTRGFANLTGDELGWLDDAVNGTDSSLHWTDVVHEIAQDTPGNSLSGTSGADTMNGGSYLDTISGNDGADTIHGNAGADTIHGNNGADTLYGDAGNDTLYGDADNDIMYGGDGNDVLYGGSGNNTLDGGLGGNFLNGSTGNDTYVYSGGDDLIDDTGGTDVITLPGGVVLGDLSFTRVSSDNSTSYFLDLLISIDGSGTIQLHNQLDSGSAHVETIVFADTSTLTLSTISHPDAYLTSGNDTFVFSPTTNFNVYGLDGNDTITFTGGNHTIDGGLGNDTLNGGSGNDTYIASPGFDTISESNGGDDTIVIPAEFDVSDVTLYRINNSSGPTYDLGISIEGLGQIAIANQFYYYSTYAVEHLHFLSDNSTLTLTNLSITTLGTAGNDTLTAPIANAGPDDIIDGREGNDNLNAGLGNDTYIFSAGADKINESGGGGDDTIRVRDHYAPGDVTIGFYQDPSLGDDNNMKLTDSDGNTIVVVQQGYDGSRGIEHIAFGNGTIWDLDSIELNTYGTSGNDNMQGHVVGDASSNDTIYGFGGNDTINGGVGDDVIYGGDGADSLSAKGHSVLYGDDGNDNIWSNASSGDALTALVTMYGGAGADTLTAGNYGQSVMDGGAGADTLWGAGGSTVSTFLFDAATAFDAVDTIRSFTKTAGHDRLDISDILDGHYNPATDVITNFVQIQTSGSNSEVYVDTTGTATFGSAQHIASIIGVTGMTDEAALVTAGTLIAA